MHLTFLWHAHYMLQHEIYICAAFLLQPYNMLTAFCSMQTTCMTHVWHMHGTCNTWNLCDVCMLYACSMPVTCKLHARRVNEHSIDATCIWHACDMCAVYVKHPWHKHIMHAQCAHNMLSICAHNAQSLHACLQHVCMPEHAGNMHAAWTLHAAMGKQHAHNMHSTYIIYLTRCKMSTCMLLCVPCMQYVCYMPQGSSYTPGTCVIHAANGRHMRAIWVEHVVYMHIECYKMQTTCVWRVCHMSRACSMHALSLHAIHVVHVHFMLNASYMLATRYNIQPTCL